MPEDLLQVDEATVTETSRADSEFHRQEDQGCSLAAPPGGLQAVISELSLRLAELGRGADEGADVHRDAYRALARETLECHVPLADRLGMQALRKRLEDASFRILDPLIYQELAQRVEPVQAEDEMCLVVLQAGVKRLLDENGIAGRVEGRTKGLYSLYRKMRRLNCPLDSIMDRIGLRVIVPSVTECYQVLELLHMRFRLVPGTFDDYIAQPKDNGYRSLHASFFPVPGLLYKPVEFQIRTTPMHYEARFGTAAHWRYKSEEEPRPEGEARLKWLRGLLEERRPVPDHATFIQQLYCHLLGDRLMASREDGQAEPFVLIRAPEEARLHKGPFFEPGSCDTQR